MIEGRWVLKKDLLVNLLNKGLPFAYWCLKAGDVSQGGIKYSTLLCKSGEVICPSIRVKPSTKEIKNLL